MKDIKLNAKLCAYTKVDAVGTPTKLDEMSFSEVDELFNGMTLNQHHLERVDKNVVTQSDIDKLFE